MIELLRDNTSYWLDSIEGAKYPTLSDDVTVDVAIVGAGIAGLTAAYLLKESGLTVAVIEKDTVGAGVSGHTTGKITSQHNLIYTKLKDRLGEETASIYGNANEAALAEIERIIRKEKLDCDFRREDNFVYTTDKARVKQFKKEADVAASLGLPASFETKIDLPFPVVGSVKFSNQATFHIGKYLQGLARAVHGNGSYVFEHSHVNGIREGKPGHVSTRGGMVKADNIIAATNVPTFPLMARGTYCIVEYPMQSYIVAGTPSKPVSGMYISPDKSHYSIHPVKRDGKQLLLIGGEGHIPGSRINISTRLRRLAAYADEHFGVKDIEYRWTHRDYLGYDDMPLVGKLYPWSKHIYTATGFMKWGMTNGTMASMILHDQIIGKPNKWSATFNPHRLQAPAAIPKVIGEKLGLR